MSCTFWRDGNEFVSLSVTTFELSPVYRTASVALGLLADGVPVVLPAGYDSAVLESITCLTGAYGQPVRVSGRQAREVAELARTLVSEHAARTGPLTLESLRNMIEIITAEEPAQS